MNEDVTIRRCRMKSLVRVGIYSFLAIGLASPFAYVGGEGMFYLATGASYFPPGTTYRRVYAPLDAIGQRWPAVDEARETLASAWIRLGDDPSRRIHIRRLYPGFQFDVF